MSILPNPEDETEEEASILDAAFGGEVGTEELDLTPSHMNPRVFITEKGRTALSNDKIPDRTDRMVLVGIGGFLNGETVNGILIEASSPTIRKEQGRRIGRFIEAGDLRAED